MSKVIKLERFALEPTDSPHNIGYCVKEYRGERILSFCEMEADSITLTLDENGPQYVTCFQDYQTVIHYPHHHRSFSYRKLKDPKDE